MKEKLEPAQLPFKENRALAQKMCIKVPAFFFHPGLENTNRCASATWIWHEAVQTMVGTRLLEKLTGVELYGSDIVLCHM